MLQLCFVVSTGIAEGFSQFFEATPWGFRHYAEHKKPTSNHHAICQTICFLTATSSYANPDTTPSRHTRIVFSRWQHQKTSSGVRKTISLFR